MSLDLGYMPEVYYYDFYHVPKFSLITEIPKYIYKSFSFMCLPSSYYHTCIYKITAKRAQNDSLVYAREAPTSCMPIQRHYRLLAAPRVYPCVHSSRLLSLPLGT
jgi:hypothetical protein